MTDMRERLSNIFRNESDKVRTNQKEVTKNIVNDIKNKIQNFKNKKISDQNIPKSSELDIHINKDMLDKFRKSKTAFNTCEFDFNQDIKANKNSGRNINTNNSGTVALINHIRSNSNTKFSKLTKEIDLPSNSNEKKEQSTTPLNVNHINNSHSATSTPRNLINSYLEETKQFAQKESHTNNFINEANKRPSNTFLNLNDNIQIRENRNNLEDKISRIENKKTGLMESLNLYSNNSKHVKFTNLNISRSSNISKDDDIKNYNNNSKNVKIKDKIKNFVFEIDGNKKNKLNTAGNYQNDNYLNMFEIKNSTNANDKFRSSLKTEKISTKTFGVDSPTLKNNTYTNSFDNQKGVKSILKSPQFSSNDALLNLGKYTKSNIMDYDYKLINKGKSGDDFYSNFNLKSKNKNDDASASIKIKAEDIRKLSSHLRFLSNDDIRKMDDNLVDELINLSSTISKIFENKLKIKEYKLK